MSRKTYEEVRKDCIDHYAKLYKDSLVFDICKVSKADRIKLQEDPVYIEETKALKASLFLDQLDTLDNVLAGAYQGEKQTDQSGTVLKALEMKQKLLLDDIGINDDVKNALNVTYTALSRDDFEALGTVEINEGNGSTELSSDFGLSEGNMSAEEKAKKLLLQKQREENKNGNN